MIWRKLGRIYTPQPLGGKLVTHAANPLPVSLGGDLYRIYYCGRDLENRSSVGSVDFDMKARKVTGPALGPHLEAGIPGTFYKDGVSIGNCYTLNGLRYILFMAWENPPGEHWRGTVGRIRLSDDLRLSVDPEFPYMDVGDSIDRVSLSYPFVLFHGGCYHMWYGSTISWDAGNGEMEHVLNYASSLDGNTWEKKGLAVPSVLGEAQAFSRPAVLYREGEFHMWFSYRSGQPGVTYRIGYAHGVDPGALTLDLEHAGIDVSLSGWDSEMIEYPAVFEHGGETYMLYNGNQYGVNGFGLAVMES